jgi:hypothetical protein
MRNVIADLDIHDTKTVLYAWRFLTVDVSLHIYFELIRCFNNLGYLQLWNSCLYNL